MMHKRNDVLQYLKNRKNFFRNKYNIVEIGIFGSYANETQSDSSDIDIILEFDADTPDLFDKKYELRKELQEYFNCHVDICRIAAIKPAFREYILSEAIFV